MTTSFSFTTPMASFSVTDPAINRSQDTDNHESFHSLAASGPKRHRTISSVNSHPITTDNTNIQQNDGNDEEDHLLGLHYDSNRLKQEKLLLIINIFRVLIICSFALILYFLV